MATMATGAWLTPGNRRTNAQRRRNLPRLWQDLRSAQRLITLQLYYGEPGHLADTLSEILRERATAGVRVFVLYDAFGTVDIPRDHRATPMTRESGFTTNVAVGSVIWPKSPRASCGNCP